MTQEDPHQALRESLGAFVLGHLAPTEADAVRAHLSGCAACRSELAEIRPVAAALAGVDPNQFESPPVPPAGLGGSIRSEVAAARAEQGRARRLLPRVPLGAVAAGAALIALAGGVVLGRSTAPDPAAAPTIPTETITLQTAAAGLEFDRSFLVNHTWGVELRIVARGFTGGETFRAAFRSRSGALVPAGEFLGVGPKEMACNLQAAVLREDVVGVVLTDADGDPVASAPL